MLDDKAARQLLGDPDIVWHQKFHLSPSTISPGSSDIEWLLARLRFSASPGWPLSP